MVRNFFPSTQNVDNVPMQRNTFYFLFLHLHFHTHTHTTITHRQQKRLLVKRGKVTHDVSNTKTKKNGNAFILKTASKKRNKTSGCEHEHSDEKKWQAQPETAQEEKLLRNGIHE